MVEDLLGEILIEFLLAFLIFLLIQLFFTLLRFAIVILLLFLLYRLRLGCPGSTKPINVLSSHLLIWLAVPRLPLPLLRLWLHLGLLCSGICSTSDFVGIRNAVAIAVVGITGCNKVVAAQIVEGSRTCDVLWGVSTHGSATDGRGVTIVDVDTTT